MSFLNQLILKLIEKMKTKFIKYISAYLLVVFSLPLNINAQTNQNPENLVNWSPEGMIVFASNAGLSEEFPQSGRVEAVVYRKLSEEGEYEEIARLQAPETVDELNERANQTFLDRLMEETNSSSEEELFNFVRSNSAIETYGFIGFDPQLWRVLGTAYFDKETLNFEHGQQVWYQIRYEMEDGSQSGEVLEGSDTVRNSPDILAPQSIDRMERDSLVTATWASPIEGSEDAYFARVYQQTGDDEFTMLEDRIMGRRNADSLIVYQYEQVAEPENAYRFFIEPIDVVGNPGPHSDTLTVISVDFENLPLLGEVEAKDTTAGIHLSWEEIPQKPYLTGIEIRRSRDARRNFITLDTLSIQTTEYLDTQLVPNRSYYYEFRIVTMRDRNELPSAVASASFTNEMLPPTPPTGLTAQNEEDGVRLNWDPVATNDLFAYYVYRGTSRYDSLVVASPAIKDTTTFFDDNPILSGRTNYVYAVKAVSLSEMESELSNMVTIRPDRIVRPPAPVGIEGYAEQSRVRLFWSDQAERDQAVQGYNLYRSDSPMEIIPDSATASIQSDQTGFERVNDSLITTTSFDDINVESGQTYYYLLSSVDVFDVESLMSNTASFTPSAPALRPPSRVSVRSVSTGVELRWNQTLQDGAMGYRVYRRARGESDATAVGMNQLEETRFTDENVSEGELYWYSVSVIGENAESEASSEESVRVD